MTYKLRIMSHKGDAPVAEWNETTSPEALKGIEEEFNRMTKLGYFAADLKTNEIIKDFKPDTDILLIPALQGG